ncbi:MAG: hypothetical protein INR68_08980 [Methylobacterium mesophilicum]|nr:hypothetical protein [Methylobacterium mesophilicum]
MLTKARKEERKLLKRIRVSSSSGGHSHSAYLVHRYLRSYSVKLSAIDTAFKIIARQNRKTNRPRSLPSFSELPMLARQVDPFVQNDERVFVWFKRKANGDHRPIMSFGLLQKAAQIMVRKALRHQFEPAEGQFALQGGRRAACAALQEALQSGEFKWAVLCDVKDCFRSFSLDALERLPLPKRVVANTVSVNNLNFGLPAWAIGRAYLHILLDFEGTAQGIPQGSSASSVVCEYLLAPVIRCLREQGVMVFNYSDNFVVLARTKKEAEDAKHLLTDQFAPHSDQALGNTVLSGWKVARVDQGFDFLGYRMQWKGGKFQAAPSDKSMASYHARFAEMLRSRRPANEMVRFVRGWWRQFSLSEYAEASERHQIARAIEQSTLQAHPVKIVIDTILECELSKRRLHKQRLARMAQALITATPSIRRHALLMRLRKTEPLLRMQKLIEVCHRYGVDLNEWWNRAPRQDPIHPTRRPSTPFHRQHAAPGATVARSRPHTRNAWAA